MRITNDSSKIIKNNTIEKKLISSSQNFLNCTVSLNSHIYLICFVIESDIIYSFTFNIENNFQNITKAQITCEDCLDELSLISSSISINQNNYEIYFVINIIIKVLIIISIIFLIILLIKIMISKEILLLLILKKLKNLQLFAKLRGKK